MAAFATTRRYACALGAMLVCCHALAAAPGEYDVKAAFIHNIAKYVDWPRVSPPPRSARLCVLGADPFGASLGALAGKQTGGLDWEIAAVEANGELKNCRVLFIAASERGRLGRILDSLGNSPVLTVADSDGYAEQGVMVNFYMEDNRVRFEINREAAVHAGLSISSQLLKLARIVSSGDAK